MKPQLSTFIIAREDQAVDPVTLVTEGLSIGRLPDCELVLNHPTVSRLHAGIKEVGGTFYVFNLSPSNSTTVNGRLVEEREAITDGDIVQIGPFFLYVSHERNALALRVIYQTAVRIGDTEVLTEGPEQAPAGPAAAGPTEDDEEEVSALAGYWEKRKREAGKITRPSPLRPHAPPRLGKARFNWTPTRDLVRPWPFAILTWAAIVVAALTVVAAFSFTTAFSPAPVSNPHTRTALTLTPAIANRPNGNTCTACHAVKASMNDACAACHQTKEFAANITPPHKAAGLGCTSCHTEHKGANFRPGLAPLSASFQPGVEPAETCAGCHNDNNKRLYNGKGVHTPHGGTFGYPVTNAHWTWMGLDQAELAQKPEQVKQVISTWPAKNEDEKLSGQFHALHLYRVRAVGGLPGNTAGELSCSSCHKSWGASLDRTTPRQTCGICHNGYTDPATSRAVIAQDQPNCNSCHVQHVEDKRHWNPSLFSQPQQTAGTMPAHDQSLIARAAR
ncbi:MAG TPA: FHA domain-containing protein [Pyrinomonadaceae bacterium]|jgi:hypothetical protein